VGGPFRHQRLALAQTQALISIAISLNSLNQGGIAVSIHEMP
jgi:hypothetical protein